MKNVEMKVEGNILTIQADLTRDMAHRHQERDHLIASTERDVAIDGHEEAMIGLNVYRKR